MTAITSTAEDGVFPLLDLLRRPEILQSNPKSISSNISISISLPAMALPDGDEIDPWHARDIWAPSILQPCLIEEDQSLFPNVDFDGKSRPGRVTNMYANIELQFRICRYKSKIT